MTTADMSNTRSNYTDEQLNAGVQTLRMLRERFAATMSDESICGAIYDVMVASASPTAHLNIDEVVYPTAARDPVTGNPVSVVHVDDARALRDKAFQAGLLHAKGWRCKASIAAGANDPQDCNWPLCGCDPHADKVIETLNEGGLYLVPCQPTKEMIEAAIKDDANNIAWPPSFYEDVYVAMVERSQKP